MARSTNQAGIDLIKKFEGLRTKAYKDAVGIWTIGYGHIKNVQGGQRISEAEAESFLRSDLHTAESAVERSVKVALSDNQFGALVAFTFNVGSGALASSTLVRKLNAGDYSAVPEQLNRWVKAGGNTLSGLVKRRKSEGDLWSTDGPFNNGITLEKTEEVSSQQSFMIYDENRYIRFEVTASSGLRLREKPDTSATTIKILPKGTMLYIGHHLDIWTSVDLEGDGKIDGWVAAAYLSPVTR